MPKNPRRSLISSRELKQGRGNVSAGRRGEETYRRVGVWGCRRLRHTALHYKPTRRYAHTVLLVARTPDKPASSISYRCSREPVVSRPNVLSPQYPRRSEAAFPCKWWQHVA